jgi:Mn-dependent DtxR family transcriptional regulator
VNLPHPSKSSIAKAMQMTPRAVQKRIARLEDEGFLRRIERRGPRGSKGSQTSEFDLSALIEKATASG